MMPTSMSDKSDKSDNVNRYLVLMAKLVKLRQDREEDSVFDMDVVLDEMDCVWDNLCRKEKAYINSLCRLS
jgi:hypothetical protein